MLRKIHLPPLGKAVEKKGYELVVPNVPFFKDTKLEGVKIVEPDYKNLEI